MTAAFSAVPKYTMYEETGPFPKFLFIRLEGGKVAFALKPYGPVEGWSLRDEADATFVPPFRKVEL